MKCRVEKRIWHDAGRTAEYACLFHETEVAQTPQRGEQLRDARWFSGQLTFVAWNPAQAQFSRRVDDEAPGGDGCDEYPYEFLIANTLHEVGRVTR